MTKEEISNKKPKSKRQIAKANSKAKFDKNKDIINAYSKGELSASDTIAYKTMLLLERNRQNTSVITTIFAIQFALSILSAIIYLIYISS
jgi:O-phosphoseryl-tRNA(Cys) synthetase